MVKKKRVVRKKKKSSNESSDDDLLQYAMGVKPKEDIIQETYWDKEIEDRQKFITYRREARRAIYKIIKYMKLRKSYLDDPKLKEMYEKINVLLDPNMGLRWDNFSIRWDLHPTDINKIVLKEHWFKEGGGVDTELGTPSPTAFTSQKI